MSKMKPEVANRRIESFKKRFGKAHLYLAYHAAFPLSLTPDLLYRLWANFQRDIHGEVLGIPWIAVADLLLSSLCDEVGHELYEMDLTVRNVLLSQLKEDEKFGQQRIHELSDFLLDYVQQQLVSDDPDVRDLAQVQQWTALAYVQPRQASRQLALALWGAYQNDKDDLLRLASLVETLAEPLTECEEFQPLLIYARGMASFARGNLEAAKAQLDDVFEERKQIRVAGVSVPVPEEIKANLPPPQVSPSKKQKSSLLSLKNQLLATAVILAFGLVGYPAYEYLKQPPQLAKDIALTQNARVVKTEAEEKIGEYKENSIILKSLKPTGLNLRNFTIEAQFRNPYDGAIHNWTYGFAFQENTSRNQNDSNRKSFDVWVTSKEKEWRFGSTAEYSNGKIPNLNVSENGSNKLRLTVNKNEATFFVNDMYIETFDVSEFTNKGDVVLIIKDGISGKLVQYENLRLLSLDN